MGLSGFILELLIPGLIAVLASIVLALEFGLVSTGELSNLDTTIAVTALLVASYLTGIALRHGAGHSGRFYASSAEIYHARISSRWVDDAVAIKNRWIPGSNDVPPTVGEMYDIVDPLQSVCWASPQRI